MPRVVSRGCGAIGAHQVVVGGGEGQHEGSHEQAEAREEGAEADGHSEAELDEEVAQFLGVRAELEPPEDVEQGREQRQELLVQVLELAPADATEQRPHELEVVVGILPPHECHSPERERRLPYEWRATQCAAAACVRACVRVRARHEP